MIDVTVPRPKAPLWPLLPKDWEFLFVGRAVHITNGLSETRSDSRSDSCPPSICRYCKCRWNWHYFGTLRYSDGARLDDELLIPSVLACGLCAVLRNQRQVLCWVDKDTAKLVEDL